MSCLRPAIAALWLACWGGEALADDSYSGGLLTMPTLMIGAATYSDVVVEVGTVVSGPSGFSPVGSADTYDPATGNLSIPYIKLNGVYYYNYVVTVKRLVSIGAVANVDTYAGGNVSSPSVQVLGGLLYNSVVATVGQVISTGGGMPKNVIDVYDPATHQLTVSAVTVGGKVYTNPVVTISAVVAAPEAIIHSFGVQAGDGASPDAGLVQGPDGSLYGMTQFGGANKAGSVFRLTPGGVETVLYSFTGLGDGGGPVSALTFGSDGNLYGTAAGGGAHGCGVVFRLTPGGQQSVLYSFACGTDGVYPDGPLIEGSDGIFYGGTDGQAGRGAASVFQLTPVGVETLLYSFTGFADGDRPAGSLVRTADGAIYGTTPGGGSAFGGSGMGTVFRITPDGKESVLHQFGGPDGAYPYSGLIQGTDGNFYGTTSAGGSSSALGAGTVFRITPDGTETVVYSFVGGSDGALPYAPLIQASDGSLYGTTARGGQYNNGTLFRIDSSGGETILYSFGGVEDGNRPMSGALIRGNDGHLYGTTPTGGAAGAGTVFRY